MHNPRRILIPVILILALVTVAAWYWQQERDVSAVGSLQASGTVEGVEVLVAPELAGRVAEVLVRKGDVVEAGQALFRLDDELLQTQRQRALAGLEAAQAGLETSRTGLESAEATYGSAQLGVEAASIQYSLTLNTARAADLPARSGAWNEKAPDEFSQPVWYFDKAEEIEAAAAEVNTARLELESERAYFEKVLSNASNADLRAAGVRLLEAQAAYRVVEEVLERAKDQRDDELEEYAQTIFDAAKIELEASQMAYDRLLTDTAAEDVKEARARLAVAQERYATAQDRLAQMLTGEDTLQVQAAAVARRQAEAAVVQAETGIAQAQARVAQAQTAVIQAQAELDLIDVQIARLTVYTSIAGVVTTRNIEPGEVIQPGAAAFTIAQMDNLTITVYVPEDRYGELRLGQPASVAVDSFPGMTFPATVIHIADQAEFTPRNVQTAEGRRTTVFAIELSIDDPGDRLKPGMPADVTFND